MNSIRIKNDLPPLFLQNKIVEIAGAIEHMHDRNVFHQTLSDQSNYVVCSENIKIIKFLEGEDSVNKFV
jgi:serine/threonine protein kinase